MMHVTLRTREYRLTLTIHGVFLRGTAQQNDRLITIVLLVWALMGFPSGYTQGYSGTINPLDRHGDLYQLWERHCQDT